MERLVTLESFQSQYTEILQEILSELQLFSLPVEVGQWIEQLMNYNVPGGKDPFCWCLLAAKPCLLSCIGKMIRGLTVARTYVALEPDSATTATKLKQAFVLGWCVEMLQALFLIADDVMDQSWTRRGHPCWFRRENVGLVAINDSYILESCIYRILKNHFSKEACYMNLVELFHEITFRTELGQLLDLSTSPLAMTRHADHFCNFTLDKYLAIVRFKTAYYSFYLPVVLALVLSGRSETAASLSSAERILVKMGEYFQIQDDYLDCFGDPVVIGKIGTDIEDHKCSWLIVQALQLANASQRAVLEEHYGKKDLDSVARIKALYMELGLPGLYERLCHCTEKEISELIGQAALQDQSIPSLVYEQICSIVFNRQK